MNRKRVLARRVCAVVAAAGMAVSMGAVCAVADEEQVWREGGGLVYPLGRDLSKTEDDGAATYVGGNLNIMDERTDPDHSGTVTVPSRAAEAEGLTVVDGFFHLAGLMDGTYTLTETTAPVGYARLEQPIRFSVRDGQVFWPEGLPVVDSTAWIANTRTGTPPNPPADSPDTPGTPGTPSDGPAPAEPGGRPQVSADDITGVEPTLASTGMGVSMAGVAVMLLASVAVGVLAARERLRPHGRHAGGTKG